MVLPNIFGTSPSGNVPAAELDVNFTFVEVQGVQGITSTGVANTYVFTPADAWVGGYSGYANRSLNVTFNVTNSGATTVNVSGLGAVALVKNVAGAATAVANGDVVVNVPYTIGCDGTQFWLLTPNASTSSSTQAALDNTGYVIGRYYGPWGASIGGAATVTLVGDQLYGVVFECGHSAIFTRVGIRVTTPEAGKSARLGLYSFVSGVPTTLIADFGTVSLASTGLIEATISQSVSPGTYALALLSNATGTAAVNTPSYSNGLSEYFLGASSTIIGASMVESGFYTARAFGSLPSPFGTIAAYVNNPPTMWLRVT